ncbi:MAG: tetraacyldisaccharide 4'-kinase [Candidatus Omnitrophota bacterium]|nr:tetraacyldisaccharide 4'-kinase [Candidatus Omnitrophota bacterium]
MDSLKMYLLSVMKDKRQGVIPFILKGALRVISWVYAICVALVDQAYRRGLREEYSAGVPVISVGNITLGGTGKTPFVILLADHFISRGAKPAILARGYGRDEDRMLRDELEGVPVFSGQDRVRAAQSAVRNGNDIIILDDGFQHRRIKRDMNILLLDAASPFGNFALFPRGVLREPRSALKRADMIVLTKTDKTDEYAKEILIKKIKALAPGVPVIITRHNIIHVKDVTGAIYSPKSLSLSKICAVSGLADPDYFNLMISRKGAKIALRFDFSDHYAYRQKDIDRILRRCREAGVEKIITTAKDYVKIKGLDISGIEDKLFIVDINIDVTEGREKLNAGLNSISPGARA